jgi:hypothetical protein
VQLDISLVLPDHDPHKAPRQTTIRLQPLDWKSEPASGNVSEDATTVVKLPPGRYQVTSMQPVPVNGNHVGWDLEVPVIEPVNKLRLSQENAVRVSPFGVGETEQGDNAAAPSTSPSEGSVDSGTRAQIEELLKRWTSSLQARDLETQMSCYAPRLDTYFRSHNVSREEVRQDKQRFLQRYPEIRQLSLSNVQINTRSGNPEVTALKSWDFGGRKDWVGQVITHLTLEREDGRWVISSERERLVKDSVPFGGVDASVSQAHP